MKIKETVCLGRNHRHMKWTYKVDIYCKWYGPGLGDGESVKFAVQFLSRELSTFFMRHVAVNRNQWGCKILHEAYDVVNDSHRSLSRAVALCEA